MSKGGTKAIGVGNHEGVLEAGAEQGSTTLQGKPIFEVVTRDHRGVFPGDEFNDTNGLRGHLSRVREDARDEDGDTRALPRFDLSGTIFDEAGILDGLNAGVGKDSR
jgi:hypothetical protein